MRPVGTSGGLTLRMRRASRLKTGPGLAQRTPIAAPDPGYPRDPLSTLDEHGAHRMRHGGFIRTTRLAHESDSSPPRSARIWRRVRWDRTPVRPPVDRCVTHETMACASVHVLCARVLAAMPFRVGPDVTGLAGPARVGLGLTQGQLGETFQTSMRTAQRCEGGQACPDVDQVQRLARAVFPPMRRREVQLAHAQQPSRPRPPWWCALPAEPLQTDASWSSLPPAHVRSRT
jgi:hypothetical protein